MKTYTADQAAKILQISEQTCRKWLREGRLPGSETPAGWRLTDDDIDSFLRRCKSRQLNEQDYSRALD